MAALTRLNPAILPKREERAAQLVAEGKLSLHTIATQLKVDPSTVDLWCLKPVFRERVLELRQEFRDRAMEESPFADRRYRVVALDALAQDLLGQIRDSKYQTILDMDDHGQPIMGFDRHRVAAFRGVLEDIAKELGDRRPEGSGVQVVVKVYGDSRMDNPFEADWSDAPAPRSSADA